MDITSLLNNINAFVLNPIILLLFVLAFLYFLWGIVKLIAGAGSEEAREIGKKNIVWGLVGMFIMFGVYGIVQIILNTFGITPPPDPYIPELYNLLEIYLV